MTASTSNFLDLMQEIYEETSLPTVEAHFTPFPKEFYLSVSKITKNVFGREYNDGKKHQFNPLEARGIDQETIVQLLGAPNGSSIQAFDLVVHTAVSSLIAGFKASAFPVFLSLSRIYRMMTMREKARLPPMEEGELMQRLETMLRIRLMIQPGDKFKKECPKFTFNETLFSGYLANGKYPSGISVKGFVLEKAPVLYRADSLIHQITKIPLDYMEAPPRMNKEYLLIKLYLTKRIEWMKAHRRGKNKIKQNIILIESVIESLGELAGHSTRRTLLQVIFSILTNMKKNGYIAFFEKQRGQDNQYRAVEIQL